MYMYMYMYIDVQISYTSTHTRLTGQVLVLLGSIGMEWALRAVEKGQ